MKYIKIGEKLQQLRKEKKLTQKQVAELLDISTSTLSGYEAEGKYPPYPTLMKLAKLYGVTTDYLIGLSTEKTIDVSDLDDDEINALREMADLLRKNKKKSQIP